MVQCNQIEMKNMKCEASLLKFAATKTRCIDLPLLLCNVKFDIPPPAPWSGEGAGALVVRLRAEQARARAAGGRGTGQKSSSNNNRYQMCM